MFWLFLIALIFFCVTCLLCVASVQDNGWAYTMLYFVPIFVMEAVLLLLVIFPEFFAVKQR